MKRSHSYAGIASLLLVSILVVGCSQHQSTEPEPEIASIAKMQPIGSLHFDIKPESCPNPLNVKSKGKLPAALLGTETVDVAQIDISSILLEGSIAPLKSSIEDVATPYTDGEECGCTTGGPDGFDDLTLKFDTHEIVGLLGPVDFGDQLTLTITGVLLDGTPFEAHDCIIIRGAPKQEPATQD